MTRPKPPKPTETPAEPTGGERLQKFLAEQGAGSRRDMEARIAAGQVSVNGETATLGQRVRPGDLVRFGGRGYKVPAASRLPRVLLYHKPEGEISSRDDAKGRTTVFERLPRIRGGKWVAIGRLDINSCGLMILTSSGDLANRLMHPRFEVEREYAVRTLGELDSLQAGKLLEGVELDDGPARFASLLDGGGEGSNHWYRVIICEGRKREVRRLFEAVGLMVSRLMRVRFGPVNLPPHLKRGALHELAPDEVAKLMHWANLPVDAPPPVQKRPGAPRKRPVLQNLLAAPADAAADKRPARPPRPRAPRRGSPR
jgi:23S rRNA pseudouridine2605 synthase